MNTNKKIPIMLIIISMAVSLFAIAFVIYSRIERNLDYEYATDPNASQRDYYVAKDIAMTEVSDVGLMLWDRVSRGTRNNILRMIGQGKKVVVITSLGAYPVTTEQDLVLI